MNREELAVEIKRVSKMIETLGNVVQNPVPAIGVFGQESADLLKETQNRFNTLTETLSEYIKMIAINEETELGRIMKLFDILRSEELNKLYYNNNIVEARALEYEIRDVFDSVIDGSYKNKKSCTEFFEKYRNIYDINPVKESPVNENIASSVTQEVVEQQAPEPLDLKRHSFYIVGPLTQKLLTEDMDKEEHLLKLKYKLIKTFDNFIKQGMRCFVTGANRGFEHIAIECLKELKKVHSEIGVVIVLPYKDYTTHWNKVDKANLAKDIKFADKVIYLDENNTSKINAISDTLHERNKFILDNTYCGLVCQYNGMTGIVADFYKEARTREGKIFQLNPLTLKLTSTK